MKFSNLFENFDILPSPPEDHHFLATGHQSCYAVSKANSKEWKILKDGLPDSIFVRVYESRTQLMRAAIVGPHVIFKVYDSDYNGKVTFNDILEVLRDLTGSFMSDKQREEVLNQVLQEAGYTRESSLMLNDFVKILDHPGVKMEVDVHID